MKRCLEKEPRERAQSALDVANELRRLGRELERGEASPPAPGALSSIAVLPFANRSASADDEYFSDGLTDELLTVLAKIEGLRVIARASSFRFKGTSEDPAVVGARLKVATLLDGSVRKSGNRVRISVHLVRAADGVQLWSETYDRSLDDIFLVQEEIAHAVVKELRTALFGETRSSEASGRAKAEVAAAARGQARNTEAHRLYLQGKFFLDRLTEEDTTRALRDLDQAVALDPAFAFAWLELSRAHGIIAGHAWQPVEESLRRARAAAERALELAPDLAEAHARLANLRMFFERDWDGAEQLLRRALELSPGNDPALRSAATLAFMRGRFEAAEAYLQRALEQDPLNAFGYHSLGSVYRHAGRFGEAAQAYRRALDLAPQRAGARANLALTLLALDRGEEALVEAEREADGAARSFALSLVLHALGRQADADVALEELIEKYSQSAAIQIAEAYGDRGDLDRALHWLERAHAQSDSGLAYLKVDPHLRALHGDPRWTAFLKKLGMEE